MEVILSQRFNYAIITPLKDYCQLSDRKMMLTYGMTYVGDSVSLDNISSFLFDKLKFITIELPEKLKKGKQRVFNYYGSEYVGEKIQLIYPNRKVANFVTESDKHIKSHYGNPFSSVQLKLLERSITRNGDKVTIKRYTQHRVREHNKLYFKKIASSHSITFNLKTGNFTTVFYHKQGRKINNQFRTNNFNALFDYFNAIMSNKKVIEHDEKYQFTEVDNRNFINQIIDTLGLDFILGPHETEYGICEAMIRMFVKNKNIKVPNDYVNLLVTHYPTEKYLKKNDRKLVASVLDAIGIKSKVTIKMLHDNLNINLSLLYKICRLLGSDYSKYINNIDKDLFVKRNESFQQYHGIHYHDKTPIFVDVSDKDKEAICFVLNDLSKNGQSHEKYESRFFNIIVDHIDMIEKIKPYYPNTCINARTWKDFNKEHDEFTKIIRLIRKGWITEYVFNQKMIEDIEKPITIELNIGDDINPEMVTETFYPFILKREDDYSEEGDFMHHCVATYSDKDKSIIISVRTEDAKDRVTCEFTTQTGQMVQARHFCNRMPPEDIMWAIDLLKAKTLKYARLGLLNCVEKRKTQVKINGIEVAKPTLTPTLNEHLFNYEVPF